MHRRRNIVRHAEGWNNGFTLVEMLVALAVFAILIGVILTFLIQMIQSERRAIENVKVVDSMATMFEQIQRDLITARLQPLINPVSISNPPAVPNCIDLKLVGSNSGPIFDTPLDMISPQPAFGEYSVIIYYMDGYNVFRYVEKIIGGPVNPPLLSCLPGNCGVQMNTSGVEISKFTWCFSGDAISGKGVRISLNATMRSKKIPSITYTAQTTLSLRDYNPIWIRAQSLYVP